uniref:Beta-defensin-like domain-containing protein n=1 Tax=Mus spicilegus TaxID=10103 RepID=A0A8C6G3S7_MUSSI
MRIHYLLFAFLLVLLSPYAAFTVLINNLLTCIANRGFCLHSCIRGFQLAGHCGHPKVRLLH